MFLEISQLDHHVRIAGKPTAPPLVLFHSLGTSHALWQAQIEALEATHFIVAPDFRGHGLSEATNTPLTIAHLADDAIAVMEACGIRRCHIAGISLGGVVAQVVAHRLGEDCLGLGLFDTYIKAADPQMWRDRAALVRKEGLRGIAPGVLKLWMTDAEADTAPGRAMARMLSACSDEAYAAACDALADADCTGTTPDLRCPTVVAFGSEDRAAPRAAADALVAAITGARLEEIPGAGHLPLLTQAERCTNILRSLW